MTVPPLWPRRLLDGGQGHKAPQRRLRRNMPQPALPARGSNGTPSGQDISCAPFRMRPVRVRSTPPHARLCLSTTPWPAVIVQTPNYFGVLEQPWAYSDAPFTTRARCWSPRSIRCRWRCLPRSRARTAPISSSVKDSRLGNDMNFGGPLVGFMACAQKLHPQMPGRIVSATKDVDGTRRVRADAADPRAAHPPREGDVEHLHQPGVCWRFVRHDLSVGCSANDGIT